MNLSNIQSSVPRNTKETVLIPRDNRTEEALQVTWVLFHLLPSDDPGQPFLVTLDLPRLSSASPQIAFVDRYDSNRVIGISPVYANPNRLHYALSPFYHEAIAVPLQKLLNEQPYGLECLIHDPRLPEEPVSRFSALVPPYPEIEERHTT